MLDPGLANVHAAHVIPVSKGAPDASSTTKYQWIIVPTCAGCNAGQGGMGTQNMVDWVYFNAYRNNTADALADFIDRVGSSGRLLYPNAGWGSNIECVRGMYQTLYHGCAGFEEIDCDAGYNVSHDDLSNLYMRGVDLQVATHKEVDAQAGVMEACTALVLSAGIGRDEEKWETAKQAVAAMAAALK